MHRFTSSSRSTGFRPRRRWCEGRRRRCDLQCRHVQCSRILGWVCSRGRGCNSPVTATTVCPETYATSFACGGASSSSNLTLRGRQFRWCCCPFGPQVATCGDVTQGDEFDSIECSVPTVDDVGVEGSTVSISLYNPDGQVATLVDGFTYLPPAPTLYSITPAEGPLTGGTPISIRGISFTSLPDMLPIIEFTTATARDL